MGERLTARMRGFLAPSRRYSSTYGDPSECAKLKVFNTFVGELEQKVRLEVEVIAISVPPSGSTPRPVKVRHDTPLEAFIAANRVTYWCDVQAGMIARVCFRGPDGAFDLGERIYLSGTVAHHVDPTKTIRSGSPYSKTVAGSVPFTVLTDVARYDPELIKMMELLKLQSSDGE